MSVRLGNAKTFADVENAITNIKEAMQRTEDYLKENELKTSELKANQTEA